MDNDLIFEAYWAKHLADLGADRFTTQELRFMRLVAAHAFDAGWKAARDTAEVLAVSQQRALSKCGAEHAEKDCWHLCRCERPYLHLGRHRCGEFEW